MPELNTPHIDVSIVIPAHNEENNLTSLVSALEKELSGHEFNYELIIVNDNSTDKTLEIAEKLAHVYPFINVVNRDPPSGFGRAIKDGFRVARGDIIMPVMGDLSDDPSDVIKLIKKAKEGYDVVYGSRFIKGATIEGYPFLKRFFNRSFNNLVRFLYGIKEKDVTNAFKAYRRGVIEKIGVENIVSNDFDVTVEIPMKAHIMGFNSVEVPVSWHGRIRGVSKLKMTKMGPLYVKRLLHVLYMGIGMGIRDLIRGMRLSVSNIVAGLTIGVLLLVSLFALSGASQVFDLIKNVSWPWLFVSGSIYMCSFLFRSLRWQVLLLTVGHKVEGGLVFRGMMFGWFLNILTPARLGDFARTVALKATAGVPVNESLSTVVVERILDLFVLLSFVLFIFHFLMGNPALQLLSDSILVLLLVLLLLLLSMVLAEEFFKSIGKRFPAFLNFLDGFLVGIKRLSSNMMALLLCISLSFFVWFFEISTVYFSAKSVGMDLNIVIPWVGGIAAYITQAVPTTPGGIGAYEVAMTGTMFALGVQMDHGVAIASIDHVMKLFIVLTVGGLSTIHLFFRSRGYFK